MDSRDWSHTVWTKCLQFCWVHCQKQLRLSLLFFLSWSWKKRVRGLHWEKEREREGCTFDCIATAVLKPEATDRHCLSWLATASFKSLPPPLCLNYIGSKPVATTHTHFKGTDFCASISLWASVTFRLIADIDRFKLNYSTRQSTPRQSFINPLVPRVQTIKVHSLTLRWHKII